MADKIALGARDRSKRSLKNVQKNFFFFFGFRFFDMKGWSKLKGSAQKKEKSSSSKDKDKEGKKRSGFGRLGSLRSGEKKVVPASSASTTTTTVEASSSSAAFAGGNVKTMSKEEMYVKRPYEIDGPFGESDSERNLLFEDELHQGLPQVKAGTIHKIIGMFIEKKREGTNQPLTFLFFFYFFSIFFF
jgi:hypothetical protein